MGLNRSAADQSLDAVSSRPRTKFGKYTLLAKIGHGGMAEVFLAALSGPAGFTKLTVIKRLHAHLYDEPAFVGMFLDEARLAARLSHPNVVQTYEVGEADGLHYLAMEYLEGQPLSRLLRRVEDGGPPVPLEVATRLFIDALDGLNYAHELRDFDGAHLGVVHRDISPGNLFICYDGTVKLLDFGIAKAGTQMMETRAGQVKGKFAYIAPEQAQARGHDRRADIWSMGVVLWETLAGRSLFRGESEITTLHNVLNVDVPPLAADVPDELGRIASRALNRDPNRRYQSAVEMKQELERFMVSSGRHASRAAVGGFVSDIFSRERTEQRKVLENCMRGELSRAIRTLEGVAAEMQSGVMSVRTRRRGVSRGVVIGLLLFACLAGGVLALILPDGQSEVAEQGSGEDPATERGQPPDEPGSTGDEPAGQAPADETAEGTPAQPEAPPTTAPEESPEQSGAENPEQSGVDETAAERETPPTPTPPVVRQEGRPRVVPPDRPHPRDTEPTRPTPERPEHPVTDQSANAALDYGFLTLDTAPWAQVQLGGRALGTTPLIRVRLPTGTHVLTLINPERGLRTTYSVTIRPGETTTRRLGLE